jgi:hypothetical protein
MFSLRRLRPRRPAAGTVLGAAALLVALSSPAVAARLVTSADIRDNTIRSEDVRNGHIRSVDIANRGIARRDLSPGALNADRLDGLDSSRYQRRCAAGSVLAWVTVAGRAAFPNAWTSDPSFTPFRQTCTTFPEVRRTGVGVYLVRVPNVDILQTAVIATPVGGVTAADNSIAVSRVTFEGVLVWQVVVRDVDNGRTPEDGEFTIAVV